MPTDAGEAGHGPKSNAHANCGNHEKYGKGRLWVPASWALILVLRMDKLTNEAQPPRWPADDIARFRLARFGLVVGLSVLETPPTRSHYNC
jgi:hypothetical protein